MLSSVTSPNSAEKRSMRVTPGNVSFVNCGKSSIVISPYFFFICCGVRQVGTSRGRGLRDVERAGRVRVGLDLGHGRLRGCRAVLRGAAGDRPSRPWHRALFEQGTNRPGIASEAIERGLPCRFLRPDAVAG